MRWHVVALAAFFVEAHPPALALRVIIRDRHADDGADPGEGVGHDADQRAIAQPDDGRGVDASQQPPRLILGQHRRLAALDHMLRPAHRMRRIDGEHLAGHQPVEQVANGGEVLFDRRLGGGRQQRLYISGDVERLDLDQADAVAFEPGEERADRPIIGHARIPVADRRCEEFKKAARGLLAGLGDHHRHREINGRAKAPAGAFYDKLVHAG